MTSLRMEISLIMSMVFPSKGPQPSKQSIATVEKAVVALEKLGYVMKRIQIFQGYSYPIER